MDIGPQEANFARHLSKSLLTVMVHNAKESAIPPEYWAPIFTQAMFDTVAEVLALAARGTPRTERDIDLLVAALRKKLKERLIPQ